MLQNSMKPIHFTKYYIWSAVLDIFTGLRLLNALQILPKNIPFSPKIRIIIGSILMLSFITMLFIDKLSKKNITDLNTNRILWTMYGIAIAFLLTAGLIQDINSMPL